MKLIILSGGSGKRLWPLSNDVRSKQFLNVLRDPKGEPESMVQRMWRQLRENNLSDQVYMTVNQAQMDLIHSQLGDGVPIVVEPDQRDTFAAIALVSAYLQSQANSSLEEVITVMPVDPFIEDHFFEKVKTLEQAIMRTGADLALIGVTPNYPSTKYGYIVPKQGTEEELHSDFLLVERFKEKPDEEQAKALLNSNALWNCGVFAFRLGYLMEELEKRGFPLEYKELLENYGKLPSISFDYEVVEKAKRVVVLPYDGYWKDLGTWNTLTEEMDIEEQGDRIYKKDCMNTHVISEVDIPVVVIGADDMVVAATSDGILVSSKEKSHHIKDIAKDWGKRPMFEEKRWGWYRAFDYQKLGIMEESMVKRLHILAGKNLSYQYHHHRSEVWVIISGTGEFVLNGKRTIVAPGDVLEIPCEAKHGIRAIADMDIIEVQMGSKLVEDDIVRVCFSWEELMEQLKDV